MPSLEYDLAFLQAGIPELQAYLLSNEVYWPLGIAAPLGERPYPKMTLGWLLLSQVRAAGWTPDDSQPWAVVALREQMNNIRERWLTAWNKKAAQEFSSRLKLWANYLNEYRTDKINANQYAYEVQRRVLLHLLRAETEEISQAELNLLKGMDSFLQATLKPGGFIWDDELASVFPKTTYWYLYGTLPGK